MRGSNTQEINEATMIEALQLYFNSIYKAKKAPTVKSVTQINNNINNIFQINTVEKDETK